MFTSSGPQRVDRKWRRSFGLNTVAFFSSRVEKVDKRGWKRGGGLTDVGTWGCDVIGGCVGKLKLAANVVRGAVCQFVYDTNRTAFLKRDLVELSVIGSWQVWVRYCDGEAVSIYTVREGTTYFSNVKSMTFSTLMMVD